MTGSYASPLRDAVHIDIDVPPISSSISGKGRRRDSLEGASSRMARPSSVHDCNSVPSDEQYPGEVFVIGQVVHILRDDPPPSPRSARGLPGDLGDGEGEGEDVIAEAAVRPGLWEHFRLPGWLHGRGLHRAVIVPRQTFREILVSPSMFLDHLPWRCVIAMMLMP